MTPPVPIIAVAFAMLAVVGSFSLYEDFHLPVWACMLSMLPVFAIGVWLDSLMQQRIQSKEEKQDE